MDNEFTVGPKTSILKPGTVTVKDGEILVSGFEFNYDHHAVDSCRTAGQVAMLWAIQQLVNDLCLSTNYDHKLNEFWKHDTCGIVD